MRWFAAMAALVLLAGCNGPEGQTSPPEGPPAAGPASPLPPPIQADGTMPPSADPVASGGPACSPPTSTCFRYRFVLPREAVVRGTLAWTLQANDLDLYVVEGDEVVAASNAGMTTRESLSVQLPAGEYRFVVQGSASVAEPFHLDATFSEPRPEPPAGEAAWAPNP